MLTKDILMCFGEGQREHSSDIDACSENQQGFTIA